MNARRLLLALLLTGCATATPAQLRDRQYAALQRSDLLEAVRLGHARVRLEPRAADARYDLACALARAGDTEAALTSLEASIELGFDATGLLERDPDLAPLHAQPRFAAITHRAEQLAREGLPIPGVRTELRGDLRLRLPTTGRAPRLAIWLHPSGARLNAQIEQLAPVLLAHGFALAVPISLWAPGWSNAELIRLLDRELPAVSDLVNVERPLLIGLSAGSHAALAAWARAPDHFSGVLAGACAPELYGAVLPVGGAPIVVINGERDPATRAWQQALGRWQQEARRVTLEVKPGRGHEFLFDEETLARALPRF